MKQLYLQNLYKLLNYEIQIPCFLVEFLFFFSLLQFISLNMDNFLWPNTELLSSPLLSSLIKLFSLTRISPILRISGMIPQFDTIFFLFFFSFIIYISFLMVRISLNFTNELKILMKEKLELEWKSVLHYKMSEFGIEILKIYNILFPILLAPLFELISQPFFELLNNSLNNSSNYKIWTLFISISGIFLLFSQMFCNIFYFNAYEFNISNSLNRTISLSDILNPLLQLFPLMNGILMNSSQKIFISITIQIVLSSILLYNFLKKHSYFDIKIMHLYGTHLFFRIMFLALLLFSLSEDQLLGNKPIIFIISIGFFYKIAKNITTMHIISVIKDQNCNDLKSIKDLSQRNSKNTINLNKIHKKFLIIYGYFYYKNLRNLDDFLKEIPLEILGFLSNHIRLCITPNCPLNRINVMNYYQINEKTLPFFEENEILKLILKDYTLYLYNEMPSILSVNDHEFFLIYILLLLTDEPKTFEAIQHINKLKNPQNLSFYHYYYIDNFLEIILKTLKKLEESHKVPINSTNLSQNYNRKLLTNFNTKTYIDIENSFSKITSQMAKYLDLYTKFLENLMAEKPHLDKILKLGRKLLSLKSKISKNYIRANKTPRFVMLYLEFLHIYCEDEKTEIISITKLYNYILDFQLFNKNDSNQNSQLFNENLFFSENSCFMHVSGSLENLGKILKVDENTKISFGYQSISAMQGQNITFLMPKLIVKKHDGFMRRFLKTGKSDFLYKEQFLFARRYNNEIFKVYMTIKPFFDKSSQILRFLVHLKPNVLKADSSIILVNQFGHIDSYGGPITEILSTLLEEYKSNFYIQVLIPQLEEYFIDSIETFFTKEQQSSQIDNNWKRKYKTKLGNGLFNNDLLNLRLYDKYPNFPQALDPSSFEAMLNKEKDLETVKSYLLKLNGLMKKSKVGCKLYRLECLIEDFKYEGLGFKLLNIEKMRFLYHRTAEEIKRIDVRNIQAFFIFPKILMQTGLLRRLSRQRSLMKNFMTNSVKEEEKDQQNDLTELEKMDDKQCSNFEIKEFLLKNDGKSKQLQDLYDNHDMRHALSCVEFGKKVEIGDIKEDYDNEKEEEELEERKSAMKKKMKSSFLQAENSRDFEEKLKLKFEDKVEKKTTENFEEKLIDEKLINVLKVTENQEFPIAKLRINIAKSPENITKENKYFTENKRLIYRFDSQDVKDSDDKRGSNFRKHEGNIPNSNLSIKKDTIDRKSDFYQMINKSYIPKCYFYLRYNQMALILIVLLSFSLLAYFITGILFNVQETLQRNSFFEKFKTKILDNLMMVQERMIFENEFDENYVIVEGKALGEEIFNILNPPFNKINDILIDFHLKKNEEIEISILSSLFYLVDYLTETPKTDEIYQRILVNSMRIFTKLEEISNMMDITSSTINDIQSKLFTLSFLSMVILALFISLQIFNVFSAFNYINNVLKLFLSIPIKEYRVLMEKILKYKEYKASLENSKNFSQIHTFICSKFNLDQNNQIITKEPNKVGMRKSVRLIAVRVNVPVVFLMLLGLLFTATFSSFLIVILYESQMLDSSLIDLLKKLNLISKTKSYNYQIFIRLTDKNFFNNLYGFKDQENEELMRNMQNFLSYAFDSNNQFGGLEQILKSEMCSEIYKEEKYANHQQAMFEECEKLGDGVLSKGLEAAFSYLIIQLNSVYQGRLDISEYKNYDSISLTIQLVDKKIYEFEFANENSIIDNLSSKNNISLSTSLILAFFLTITLLLIHGFLIEKFMKNNLLEVRNMLKLINVNFLLKSTKVRKYLVSTSSQNKKKNRKF